MDGLKLNLFQKKIFSPDLGESVVHVSKRGPLRVFIKKEKFLDQVRINILVILVLNSRIVFVARSWRAQYTSARTDFGYSYQKCRKK